jgi:carboxypeptidase T
LKSISLKSRIVSFILSAFLLAVAGLSTRAQASASPAAPDGPVVVRVYYGARENLDTLAKTLDIWEVNPEQAYLVALVSPERYAQLDQAGYRLEIDAVQTTELNQLHEPLPGQGADSIPGYLCYRTVEETFINMESLAANHPSLATWIDIGDSWDKLTAGGPVGYDLYALDLTNKITPGPKPTFFLMAEIHAREYVTAETAARFAEYLVSNYGIDPDITWLLDYYHVYIVPITNPDGRKKAETGLSWRKNTDSDDGCSNSSSWGTDLNRNMARRRPRNQKPTLYRISY